MTNHERTVIVGASLAGTRAAGAMRAAGYAGEILLVGDERELPYERPPLSKELLGASPPSLDDLRLEPRAWYAAQAIELRLGARAIALDVARREVRLATGEAVAFDRLLVATGASPRRLAVPGGDHPSVVTLRTAGDARVLAAALGVAARVVVVGAGMIGLEIAAAARAAGRDVTVVERDATALARLGGPALGDRVVALHQAHGVTFRLRAEVARIDEAGPSLRVVLTDDTRLDADLVVVAIGVAPATGWLAGSGVATADGVIVDAFGETSVPGVFAAGDVARGYHPGLDAHVRFETYAHAHDHGVAVGRALAGAREPFAPLPGGGSTQYGVRIQAVGAPRPGDALVVRDDDGVRAVGLHVRDGVVVGAFAIGRPRELVAARRLVAAAARVSPAQLADPGRPLATLA